MKWLHNLTNLNSFLASVTPNCSNSGQRCVGGTSPLSLILSLVMSIPRSFSRSFSPVGSDRSSGEDASDWWRNRRNKPLSPASRVIFFSGLGETGDFANMDEDAIRQVVEDGAVNLYALKMRSGSVFLNAIIEWFQELNFFFHGLIKP